MFNRPRGPRAPHRYPSLLSPQTGGNPVPRVARLAIQLAEARKLEYLDDAVLRFSIFFVRESNVLPSCLEALLSEAGRWQHTVPRIGLSGGAQGCTDERPLATGARPLQRDLARRWPSVGLSCGSWNR